MAVPLAGYETPSPMRIGKLLLVEDDALMRGLVGGYLRNQGFHVEEAANGASARARFGDSDIDLIVLDIRLPDVDGFDLLRELRQSSQVPIVIITGNDSPMDRVAGLELGADDYICKPFELRELKARIRSVLRRVRGLVESDLSESAEILAFANLTLDVTHRRLLDNAGHEINLTGGEYELLRIMAEHPRRPLSRDQLLDRTRSRDWTPFDRSIDVLIGRLRRKLEAAGAANDLIKTVRNVGYMLASEVKRRRIATGSPEFAQAPIMPA